MSLHDNPLHENPDTTVRNYEPETMVLGGQNAYNPGPGPWVMAADTLEGDDVVNSDGESLGSIKHIMLDVRSGRIAYAVLASGGLLGIGEKLYAIPWSALTLDADRKCFILHVAKNRLEGAPGFDKDHWPTTADATWSRDERSH